MQQLRQCPAIVLGNGETALGTIRSLHRAGIEAIYSAERSGIAGWSRFHKRMENWPTKTLGPVELEAWLESTGLDSAVLMPCSDSWTQSVSRLSEKTCERFRRWTPGSGVVDLMIDKNRFRAVLEKLNLPHPRSYFLQRDSGAWRVPDSIYESAFLKPHDSLAFFTAFGVKGFSVSSADDALHKVQDAWNQGIEMLIQEYIPGPPTNHYFIDGYRTKDGMATQFLARQRLQMYPPDFGNSTDMVTVPLESVQPTLETLHSLFDHTGFHGIFSAEFKLDDRDGQFKILEVNCRPWWFIEYADRCGLSVCHAAYADVLDLPIPEQPSYKLGRRGTYPVYDWEAFRNDDDRGAFAIFVLIFNWVRSYQTVLSWSDPMPAVMNFYTLLSGKVRRRMARV
jgi:predicted ATP-grasp superfamily ATP-dependent carboligase